MTVKKLKCETNSNLISESNISDSIITNENLENNEITDKIELTENMDSTENSKNLEKDPVKSGNENDNKIVGITENMVTKEPMKYLENTENTVNEENEESKQFSKLLFLDRFSFKNMHVRALESTEVMTEMGKRNIKTAIYYLIF